MTVLENSIRINASPEDVWSVLGKLDALHEYDPGVTLAKILDGAPAGVGAARQCDLAPGGWFRERVTSWQPAETIGFELYECALPVKSLRHTYTLEKAGDETVVRQRMEYELKFGPLGKVMDALMVRKKWDSGIKGFFVGLKRHVEEQAQAGGARASSSAGANRSSPSR
ncbi:MAG: SRPBCC family protein [Myxococcales bacterium]|nr:SRPBCC family protein [Myxococcales bacterium]